MAKNKITLELKGFDELIANLEALNGDTKEAVEGCLRVASDTVAKKATAAMRKHNRTGATSNSIVKHSPVTWEGNFASVDVGFNLKKGGMPSIFLMYGTPKMPKDQAVYDAVYGNKTKREIAKRQAAIFNGMINKRMGG